MVASNQSNSRSLEQPILLGGDWHNMCNTPIAYSTLIGSLTDTNQELSDAGRVVQLIVFNVDWLGFIPGQVFKKSQSTKYENDSTTTPTTLEVSSNTARPAY